MGPLDGIRVIEMAGLAPSPYCGMLLSDFGAEVVVVDRLTKSAPETPNIMTRSPFDRGKRSMRVDLKRAEGIDILRRMIQVFDVLVEPYRPRVMESLGVGPEEALSLNHRLIYARLTGWGQAGPYSQMAGHDINYIALSGALSLFKRKGEKPLPPCNVLGDFAGGGMLCAVGIMLALIERNRSGKGQVVDAAMLDGAANLSTLFYGLVAHQLMTLDIGTNMLDSGAPYYQTYETSDGKYVAVGAIESRFYARLIEGLALDPASLPAQNDRDRWPEMTLLFAEIFKTRTRDEWASVFEGTDACVAPVLDLNEVGRHPHNLERELLVEIDGVAQPSPAPRLSRTPGWAGKGSGVRGAHTREILESLGFPGIEIETLLREQVIE